MLITYGSINMALTNKFTEQVLALASRGVKLAESAHALGCDAVKSAYANNDLDKAQFLLDNVPQYMRRPFAAWFKRAGLDVAPPTIGSARFTVLQVIDKKRQAKAFTWVDSNPVLSTTHEVKQEKKTKELKGTADERAQKAMASLISRLKDSDPDASALINEVWTTERVMKSCLFHENGNYERLDQAELEVVRCVLQMRRNIAA
jgi:hypothetical protein